jgi:hypothetical protein
MIRMRRLNPQLQKNSLKQRLNLSNKKSKKSFLKHQEKLNKKAHGKWWMKLNLLEQKN